MGESNIIIQPSIDNEVNKKKYLLDYLNKFHLPKSVLDLTLRLYGKSSVFDDLYQIRRDLEKVEDSKPDMDEMERDKEMYFKNLFLGLVYFFLIPERSFYKPKALTCLKYAYENTKLIVAEPKSQEIIYSTIVSLIYKLERSPKKDKIKILIIVDERYPYGNDTELRSFNRRYFKNYITVKWIAQSETPDVIDMLSEYDQLFIFAHGDDVDGTSIGNIGITDEWMKAQWVESRKRVKVLGIFSCQENPWKSEIVGLFDYFMTDSPISAPNFNELFLYVYLSSYIRTRNIVDSFHLGRIGPVFRTSSDVGYELYEGGMRID